MYLTFYFIIFQWRLKNSSTASTVLTTDGAGTLISEWAMTVLMLVSLTIILKDLTDRR